MEDWNQNMKVFLHIINSFTTYFFSHNCVGCLVDSVLLHLGLTLTASPMWQTGWELVSPGAVSHGTLILEHVANPNSLLGYLGYFLEKAFQDCENRALKCFKQKLWD